MIEGIEFYLRDVEKRRVVLMHERRAVVLCATPSFLRNDRFVHVVRMTGANVRVYQVPIAELYEPREPEHMLRFQSLQSARYIAHSSVRRLNILRYGD